MKDADSGHDESMEEILASIRKIIADDLATSGPAAPAAVTSRPRTASEPPQRKEPVFEQPPSPFEMGNERSSSESEILDLGEEFLISDGEPNAQPPETDIRRTSAADDQRRPAELSSDLSLEGERRPWDEQPPIAPSNPVAPLRATSAPEQQMRTSDRGGSRSAWSGLEAGRDSNALRPETPRSRHVGGFNEPGSGLWPQRDAHEAWTGGVQMPVPPSGPGPLTPFPQTQPGKSAAPTPPQQQSSRPSAQAAGPSRLNAPVTGSGSPGSNMGRQPHTVQNEEAAISSKETGEPPQYVQTMAEELARATISGLGDRELADARNVKFSQVSRPVLSEVTSSFADVLAEARQQPVRENAPAPSSGQAARPPLAAAPSPPPAAPSIPPLVAKPEPTLSYGQPAPAQAASSAPQSIAAPEQAPASESGKSLEDSFRALLRPMLEEWLNENMPRLLEEAVQEEVKRRLGGQ